MRWSRSPFPASSKGARNSASGAAACSSRSATCRPRSPDGLLREADLRARLQGPAGTPPHDGLGLIAAAVLVGIIHGPTPGVLLTRRTTHLRRHSGQVAFPGGRIDPGDLSPEHAALREAQEEVGLDPAHAELLGRLPDQVTGTGFVITPVLALLRPGFIATPSPHEVAAVFQLPLAVLLDPQAPQRRSALHDGVLRQYWVWPHPDHEIWGATAAILMQLAARLSADASSPPRTML